MDIVNKYAEEILNVPEVAHFQPEAVKGVQDILRRFGKELVEASLPEFKGILDAHREAHDACRSETLANAERLLKG